MTELILTKDGSHSLLNTELNETYHSTHGAIQESKHVFIREGLDHIFQKRKSDPISILEIGFGTGLNALLTLQRASEIPNTIQYTTLEAYPLEPEIWTKLNYSDTLGWKEKFETLHTSNWNEPTEILSNFRFLKQKISLQQAELPKAAFDIVYYDAFAPNKQPEMWTVEMLGKVIEALRPKGVLVTYCAKGQLKRDLKSLGSTVETLPGPPGKKEMVRATKEG